MQGKNIKRKKGGSWIQKASQIAYREASFSLCGKQRGVDHLSFSQYGAFISIY